MMIRFLPLDLPKFEYKQETIQAFNATTKFGYWDEEELTERVRDEPFEREMPFKEYVWDKYPHLISYIKDYWPFEYFVYVKLIRANRTVEPHVDGNFVEHKGPVGNYNSITQSYLDHQLETEPCGYRMVLNGNRSSLYLCDEYDPTYKKHDWTDLKKDYCAIPESTDCFVLRTNNSPHGVDFIENDDERLLLFAIGKLNIHRHNELIQRSIEKYKGKY